MLSSARFAIWMTLCFAVSLPALADDSPFAKWEKEIAKFEEADRAQPPAKGGVVFVGSSSIRMWDLKKSFPGQNYLNRGFGGSQIPDATHFVDRIVVPYEPKVVVFYSGDNDINSGKPAEKVAEDFEQFAAAVWAKLPQTRIVYIAIKPSPSRAKHFETQTAANLRIRRFALANERLTFLDVVPAMLNESGQAREELFVGDKLHMNATGYELWTSLLKPHLKQLDELRLDQSQPGPIALLKAKRVVFLGDSITYAGQYLTYLEFALTARYPHQRFDFIDLGLPSETCSGLSEPGHAGGKFPRPNVHERLQRMLDKLKPELVVACYGMNCGMYHPLSDDRFAAYQDGIKRLREAAHAAGAQVIHLTPPTFDPQPLAGRTLPAGRKSYSQPYEGYNEVLDKYSEWLVSQREHGWTVIDLHSSMNAALAERRKTDPKFVLAGDGVHAGATGHWLMADAILNALMTGARTFVEHGSGEPSELTWTSVLPCPRDPAWDAIVLAKTNFARTQFPLNQNCKQPKAKEYSVLENDTPIGSLTAEQLQTGFDLTSLPKLSLNARASELLKLIQKRQRILTDAWLNEVGHLRPGMSKGLPVNEAIAQADELAAQIMKLAQPTEVKVRFVAK